MRWDEYVEEATAAIRSRNTARDVRRELRDHLESATQALVSEGMAQDEAEAEAMRRLGPVDVLRQQYRIHYRPWAPAWPAAVAAVGFLASVFALGIHNPGVGVLTAIWTVSWSALHLRSFAEAWRRPWSIPAWAELLQRVQPVRPLAAAGAAGGLLGVLAPFADRGVGPVAFLLAALAAGGAWYAAAVRVEAQHPDLVAPLGSGAATVALVAVAAFLVLIAGEPWQVADALLGGALYFSGAQALAWTRRARRAQTERERLPLAVQGPAS